MHNFETNYEKISEVLLTLGIPEAFLKQIRKPKLSDRELMGINLTAEYMGIDSEHQLFRVLPEPISSRIDRSVYNRRKRKLFAFMEQIRQQLSERFNSQEEYYIVDSMPLEVCKLSRSSRSKICKDQSHSSPDKGYCASQASSYYGYKLHAVCSVKGVFKSLDISPASVHDIHYLKDIKAQMADCTLIGDKGYLSSQWQLDLFNSCNIKLNTPMRSNQKGVRPQPYLFKKCRKRIETLFSQLCDQFMIRRNYAKTFSGFKTRILSKITALTIVQFLNHFVFNRNLNIIKINLH
tara:strand:- start:132 stop:1010 length:879 start_codon:yes stop_codon:yes gene_type:complete